MSRKLASVRRVADILSIEGADKIVMAKIDGWQVVTQKGWCKPGDLVCYFEVDSFLPVRPEYEFLRKSGFKSHPDLGDGFRLKTIKLRGQLSQGLIIPLDEVLAEPTFLHGAKINTGERWVCRADSDGNGLTLRVEEGADLTEILGVKLYEKPLPRSLAGKIKGNFPGFIQKTDQERVQNILQYLPEYFGRKYQATLKLDGSSMTIYARSVLHGVVLGEFGAEPTNMTEVGVCSRNLDLKLDDDTPSLFLRAFRELGLEEKIRNLQKHLGVDIAVQGELMGPGIQGNRERLEGLRFFVFDMYNIKYQSYFDPVIVEKYAQAYGFDHVPVIAYLPLNDLWEDSDPVSGFLDFADHPSLNHNIAEGVVFKAASGDRHSFKVVNNAFLLKEKD